MLLFQNMFKVNDDRNDILDHIFFHDLAEGRVSQDTPPKADI